MVVVITLPDFFEGEIDRLQALLDRPDVDIMHIRKPASTEAEMDAFIAKISPCYYHLLVLHDFHHLAEKYKLYGIHLNSRNPIPLSGWKGSVSRSCHSFEELSLYKNKCDYLSLSPIFDSISKKGYCSTFSAEDIKSAHSKGIIDKKVLALGGVTFEKIPVVMNMGFGGAMILGDAWR